MRKDREDIQSSPNKLEECKYELMGRSVAQGHWGGYGSGAQKMWEESEETGLF